MVKPSESGFTGLLNHVQRRIEVFHKAISTTGFLFGCHKITYNEVLGGLDGASPTLPQSWQSHFVQLNWERFTFLDHWQARVSQLAMVLFRNLSLLVPRAARLSGRAPVKNTKHFDSTNFVSFRQF